MFKIFDFNKKKMFYFISGCHFLIFLKYKKKNFFDNFFIYVLIKLSLCIDIFVVIVTFKTRLYNKLLNNFI